MLKDKIHVIFGNFSEVVFEDFEAHFPNRD